MPNKNTCIHTLFFGTFFVLLSGCTSYEESFSSEPGKGSGWKSMSETYAMEQSLKDNNESKQSPEKPIPIESDGSFTRRPEEFLKVWFAPFEDAEHNFYAESSVMTIVQQGQWVI